VGLETQDPEESDSRVEYSGGSFQVAVDFRSVRNCAECSSEMKDFEGSAEGEFPLEDLDGWTDLSEEQRKELTKALEDGSIEPSLEVECGSTDESGGSRYRKNILTTTFPITISVEYGHPSPKTLTISGDVQAEAAASEYNELM
jgi:hypothetical protein